MKGLVWAAALIAIASAGECRGSAAAKPRERPMKLIDKELLRGCLDRSMHVVLGRVTSASIRLPGTRSRSSVCYVEVLDVVCGDLGRTLTLWQYTGADEPHLRQGATYVLAVSRQWGVKPPPNSMIEGPEEAIEVQAGEEKRAVEAHREAVAALRKEGR
jgi:hypothetical protein